MMDKLGKQFAKLGIANRSFAQAHGLAKHMIAARVDTFDDLFHPQMAGIVVTYCKNFNESNGFGPLGAEYRKFEDLDHRHTHEILLQSRNKLYAHRDKNGAQEFVYDNESESGPYELKIRFAEDTGGLNMFLNIPDLNCEILPYVCSLCEFQIERTTDEMGKLLHAICERGEYKRGKLYTVGENFP
jgi:hypothetical protein